MRRLLSFIIVLFLSFGCVAQQRDSIPTFTSRTELVLVPTVVVDHQGKHIPGLTAKDFSLRQDGDQKQIAFFEEVTPKPSDRAKDRSGLYSNYVVGEKTTAHLTIFALDLLNTPFAGQAEARKMLLERLAAVVNDGQPKSLVVFTRSGVRVLHDFTTDSEALAVTLRRVVSNSPNLNTKDVANDPLYARLSDFSQAKNWVYDEFWQREVVDLTETCFRQIATAFAGVPGRKALVWVTAGFPYTSSSPRIGMSNFPDYDRTWRALNAANVAIYPVDVRDISIPGFSDATRRRRLDMPSSLARGGTVDSLMSDLPAQQSASMLNFARETGGTSCIGRIDLSECFNRAEQDSDAYYIIGYYLDHQTSKPGWHKLEVKTSVPKAVVRSRKGFEVTEPGSKEDLKTEIETAVTAPLDYTAIPISAKWDDVTAADAGTKRVKFELVMPPNAFALEEQDQNHMDLEVLAVSRMPDGRAVLLRDLQLDDHFKQESANKIKQNGFRYHDTLEIAPGDYSIRFVIRDNVSKKIGSVTAPLRVQ